MMSHHIIGRGAILVECVWPSFDVSLMVSLVICHCSPTFLCLAHSSVHGFTKDIICSKLGLVLPSLASARPLLTHFPGQVPVLPCATLPYITFPVGTITCIHIVSCIRLPSFQSLRPCFIHLCVPIVFRKALGLVTLVWFGLEINQVIHFFRKCDSVLS